MTLRKEIEKRIWIGAGVLEDADQPVKVYYHHLKTNRVKTIYTVMPYAKALDFCRTRMHDGRYKNFEMWIGHA